MAAMEAEIFGEEQKDELPEEFQTMSAEDIARRCACRMAAGQAGEDAARLFNRIKANPVL